uniref:Uncharacterized protein LOC102807489 n=1 Tax=Saccoglossus kowalevskii TaxID=10224 RepID=A0ABM0MHH7_SACKO|nr:PREDICTED: uncharacterized protein LOC102807489 [Saccoglossus kowalevskii]
MASAIQENCVEVQLQNIDNEDGFNLNCNDFVTDKSDFAKSFEGANTPIIFLERWYEFRMYGINESDGSDETSGNMTSVFTVSDDTDDDETVMTGSHGETEESIVFRHTTDSNNEIHTPVTTSTPNKSFQNSFYEDFEKKIEEKKLGVFAVPISSFVEPEKERLVRPLNEKSVKAFEKILTAQPGLVSEYQQLIGNIPKSVVSFSNFTVNSLSKYKIEAIDGNHSFHAQLSTFKKTGNPKLATREARLYYDLSAEEAKTMGIRRNMATNNFCQMDDFVIVQHMRCIIDEVAGPTTKDDDNPVKTEEFYMRTKLMLAADGKTVKMNSFRTHTLLASLSRRNYRMLKNIFEKMNNLKVHRFKGLHGIKTEDQVFQVLSVLNSSQSPNFKEFNDKIRELKHTTTTSDSYTKNKNKAPKQVTWFPFNSCFVHAQGNLEKQLKEEVTRRKHLETELQNEREKNKKMCTSIEQIKLNGKAKLIDSGKDKEKNESGESTTCLKRKVPDMDSHGSSLSTKKTKLVNEGKINEDSCKNITETKEQQQSGTKMPTTNDWVAVWYPDKAWFGRVKSVDGNSIKAEFLEEVLNKLHWPIKSMVETFDQKFILKSCLNIEVLKRNQIKVEEGLIENVKTIYKQFIV